MVPYKGATQAVTDVMGGVLDATLDGTLTAIPQSKAGNLRALGTTVAKRNAMMPDTPTIAETIPGFDFPLWNAFVGSAGMPRELAQQLANAGSPSLIIEPGKVKAFIDAEVTKCARLAKEAGIQPE